jgi:hypothetical protein
MIKEIGVEVRESEQWTVDGRLWTIIRRNSPYYEITKKIEDNPFK